ncbi:MAG: Flp pilus assembly complex ATPase component TadA, partial [Candidatus Omnitrophica bacterium]|nr:Flp pilus assembly complex ATPase component TadA [Candidatus Omnitrophota bacterium]
NVILIGEIRDKETAEIAVKASMTGHLVLSTLHTNSTIGTITRLADIGLDYYQIASSVILILSQRLIKHLCAECKIEYEPDDDFKKEYASVLGEYKIEKFFKGKGCPKCNYSGYYGRIAVFEVLKVGDELKTLISSGSSEDKLMAAARKHGLKLLIEKGIEKVQEGVTTLEEVTKVLGSYESGEVAEQQSIATAGASMAVQENIHAQPSSSDGNPSVNKGKAKILAVDDEADILKVLVKYLQMGGYDVVQATNGQEALEVVHREKPDLILTDLMMPVMDGIEMTKILRSKLETAVIPIMMLTAKQSKDSELEGINAGADDYLTKPYDKDKLLSRVKMLLRRRNVRTG